MNSKFLFVFALLFVLVAVASGSFSDHEERRLFMDFMKQYSKTYQHDEYRIRFQNFKDNLKRIRDLNSQPGQTAVYAINKFADLSADEFRQTYLMPKFDAKNVCKFPYHFSATPEEVAAIPNTFDWRTKGAVSMLKIKEVVDHAGHSRPSVTLKDNGNWEDTLWSPSPNNGSLIALMAALDRSLLSATVDAVVGCLG